MLFKNRKAKGPMALDEAKTFYMDCLGSDLYMYREDPKKHNAFLKLKLDKKILDSWNAEIMAKSADIMLGGESSCKWISFGNYFDALERTDEGFAEHTEKFYTLIDHAAKKLDPLSKILMMEEFGGRKKDLSDGIIRRISEKEIDRQRLRECIGRLVDFVPEFTSDMLGWKQPAERYLSAKEQIDKALNLYF